MNESSSHPQPSLLPIGRTPLAELASTPLGEHPDDIREIGDFPGVVESVLRHPRRIIFHLHRNSAWKLMGALLTLAIVCSLIYGLIVGSFSGGVQLWAAPLKISLGMIFAAFICLPSLYIFACLGGSQARLGEVLGLLLGMLTLTTLLLIGFAPVAWIFSRSIESVVGMGVLHLLFSLISIAFGARFLRAGFGHLGIRSGAGISLWLIVFLLVILQMTTVLRPIIGSSGTLLTQDKKFFLVHWVENMEGKKPIR